MVDFKKLMIDWELKRTPEERARSAWNYIDNQRRRKTSRPVTATFERLSAVRFGDDKDARMEIKHIPMHLRHVGDEVLPTIPDVAPEGRLIEIHRLSESRLHAEMIEDGLIEDASFAVDITNRELQISFEEAVTGYERYTIDEGFVQGVIEVSENNEGEFYICAGRRGSYDACKVRASEVLDFLRTLGLPSEVKDLLEPRPAGMSI